jgi:hypothetical protein
MSQVWHIFKKDVRYLRLEVSLLFILALLYAWTATRLLRTIVSGPSPFPTLALILLSIFVIARLVHAEAIPGDKQFWITRPYRWKQLLAAKFLFILVFFHGPLLVAQLLIIHAEQFPVLANLPALIWTQVLWFLCLSLPAAALGAITSGFVPFVVTALGFMGFIGIFMKGGPLREAFWAPEVAWVEIAAVLTVLLASAAVVLLLQYRYRRTLHTRIFAAVAAFLGIVVAWTLPLTFDLEAQTRTARQPAGVLPIQIVMNPYSHRSEPLADVAPSSVIDQSVWMQLPLALSSVPTGAEIHIDALAYEFEGADGRVWRLDPSRDDRSVTAIQNDVFVDTSFFNAQHRRSVTFRATAYLTVFGDTEEKTFTPQPWPAPVNITPQVQCYQSETYLPSLLKCRTAFRQPSQLFYAITDNETVLLRFITSYSPFPAALNLNPVQDGYFFIAVTGSPVTLIMKHQLAHLRRDLEVRNVSLDDFVVKRH